MIKELILPAPAKINLFLHILGRRADGYHDLQTVFQLLDYGDSLSFSLRKDGLIKVSCQIPIPLEDNLIYRVAKHLQQISNTEYGVTIVCHKKIPLGAGLGGGSSNAATTLHGLNQLWNLELSLEQLTDIALQFGADIPLFVRGENAWAEGVGENLQPIKLTTGYYLVITSQTAINTKKLFSHPKLKRDYKKISPKNWRRQKTENAFLAIVLKEYPEVKKTFDWLNKHADAKLTGTGSSVFAYFKTEKEAQKVLKKFPKNIQGFIAKTLTKSSMFNKMK